jgi:hypothetical protein
MHGISLLAEELTTFQTAFFAWLYLCISLQGTVFNQKVQEAASL